MRDKCDKKDVSDPEPRLCRSKILISIDIDFNERYAQPCGCSYKGRAYIAEAAAAMWQAASCLRLTARLDVLVVYRSKMMPVEVQNSVPLMFPAGS